ncbi:MAG: hypothetical protein WCP66_12480 [Methylococcales bacterium]
MKIDTNLQELMMSDTLKNLWAMSLTGITDVNSKEDLKTAFSTCSMELIAALDNNRIRFNNTDDKAIFYGLLTVLVDFVMDGNLKALFKEAISH